MNEIWTMVLLILLMVLGIVYCFWGYKYLKLTIMLYAIFAGGTAVYNFLSQNAPELGNGVWIIAISVGLVLGLLAFFFVKFAIFIAGGILGLAVFSILRSVFPAYFGGLSSLYVFLIGLACFIIFGIIALAAKKPLLVVVTAVFGAYSMVYIAGILIGLIFHPSRLRGVEVADAVSKLSGVSVFSDSPMWVMLLPVAVFAIAGVVAQTKYTAKGAK